jgi:hypothetical protein
MNTETIIVIAVDQDGEFEVIGEAGSLYEARELKAENMRRKMADVEAFKDPGICPLVYQFYRRGMGLAWEMVQEVAA